VQSLINPDVHYPEVDVAVDPEDVGYSSTVCELEFPNQEGRFMLIALGKLKYTFHNRGILYYPVYLLSLDDRKTLGIKAKIGVAEVPVKHLIDLLDEDKEVRLDMLEDPLLFAFANEDYLERFSTDKAPATESKKKHEDKTVENNHEETSADDDDDDSSDSVKQARQLLAHGIFSEAKRKIVVPAAIPEETETEALTIEDAFQEDKTRFWVQNWLKNDRYVRHAVLGTEADSLFACLADAFQQMGQDTTVSKLRAAVALEATFAVFQERREAYEHLAKTMDDKKTHVKKIKEKLLELNRTASKVQDLKDDEYRSVTAVLRDMELEKKDKSDDLLCDERLVKEMVGTEFRDVTTLGHFREFIMTNRFYCDDWALGVLEQRLKAKVVVFSEAEYQDGDVDHVLRCCCGGPKKPEYYMLLNQTVVGRYELVGYKNKDDVGKKLMTFSEIPWSLKQRMAQQCAESRHKKGGFDDVVKDLATQRGYHDADAGGPADEEEEVDEGDVVFQFHRRAASRASPGKGPGEQITIQEMRAFQPLRRLRSWRQKLDDTWPHSKFSLDGKSWASVTHYTQSQQFRKKNPEYADTFALDSKTALSKSVDLALSATTDEEVKDGVKAKPSQIHVDKEFTKKEAQEARVKALHAKFTQNADLTQLLKATAPAKLMHYVPRRVSKVDAELMALRQTLLV
jgi:hypothetical protein